MDVQRKIETAFVSPQGRYTEMRSTNLDRKLAGGYFMFSVLWITLGVIDLGVKDDDTGVKSAVSYFMYYAAIILLTNMVTLLLLSIKAVGQRMQTKSRIFAAYCLTFVVAGIIFAVVHFVVAPKEFREIEKMSIVAPSLFFGGQALFGMISFLVSATAISNRRLAPAPAPAQRPTGDAGRGREIGTGTFWLPFDILN